MITYNSLGRDAMTSLAERKNTPILSPHYHSDRQALMILLSTGWLWLTSFSPQPYDHINKMIGWLK